MIHIAGVNEEKKNLGWFLKQNLKGSKEIPKLEQPWRNREILNPDKQSFVCCIGELNVRLFESFDSAIIRRMIFANLEIPIRLVNQFINAYPNAKKKIILISSMAYTKALRGYCVYGAAKAGLVSFAKHLAYEMAGVEDLLKIWTISPGTISYSPMFEKLLDETAEMKQVCKDTIIEEVRNSFPDKRLVDKRSILDVVKFCLSGQADQMSGHCFEIANCQR